MAGALILSIFEGAYIAEIIRGSLLSIEDSQLEAAKAVGFTGSQTVRYVLLPQLIARTLPALTGQFASIIKDSSLLSMIAVIELTQTVREISATNFKLFECYLALGLLYLCLTLPISFISSKLERRFQYEN
ncbi:MAG: ABC transporter permease subunit [Hungatella hathewayi]